MDLAEWMLQHGNQVSVVSLLGFEFFFGCIALYKRWIVLGWVHKGCEERLERFEKAATDAAERANHRIEDLESLLDGERARPPRRRTQ